MITKNKKTLEDVDISTSSSIKGISIKFKLLENVPGEIRTPDRTLRRRMLYPAELLGHIHI